MADSKKKKTVRFLKGWKAFNAGESAAFSGDIARFLESKGIGVIEGAKTRRRRPKDPPVKVEADETPVDDQGEQTADEGSPDADEGEEATDDQVETTDEGDQAPAEGDEQADGESSEGESNSEG